MHFSLNNAVPVGTFTNALTINVLLVIVDHDIVDTNYCTHSDAIQLIVTVSAVVVQSGAIVVFAVTEEEPVEARGTALSALGLLKYCVSYCRFSGI